MLQVVQVMDSTAKDVLSYLAVALGLPNITFDRICGSAVRQPSASSLEAIHYMLPDTHAADIAAPAACEAHVDKGLLTLISSDASQGLQVLIPTLLDAHISATHACTFWPQFGSLQAVGSHNHHGLSCSLAGQ